MELKNKGLGELINEMIVLIIKEPEILQSDYKSETKKIYEEYMKEINQREQELYKHGRRADTLLTPLRYR